MIRTRLQIGDGEIKDTYDAYGLIYLSSDTIFAAPTKGFATSSYAEQAGENIDPRTVDDAFDYKVRFCIEAPNKNLLNANDIIRKFNELMYAKEYGNGVKAFKTFTFYNDYKRVKIVGVPQPISNVDDDDFFRDKHGNVKDAVIVELTIRVTDPTLCDFSLKNEDLEIVLTTDGERVYVQTSRPLKSDEHPVLLRKGRAVTGSETKQHYKRRHKWCVYYKNGSKWPFYLGDNNLLEMKDPKLPSEFLGGIVSWKYAITFKKNHAIAVIRKSQHDTLTIPFEKGRMAKCCFGVAIYKDEMVEGKGLGVVRVSNVQYFRNNVKIDDDSNLIQWISV